MRREPQHLIGASAPVSSHAASTAVCSASAALLSGDQHQRRRLHRRGQTPEIQRPRSRGEPRHTSPARAARQVATRTLKRNGGLQVRHQLADEGQNHAVFSLATCNLGNGARLMRMRLFSLALGLLLAATNPSGSQIGQNRTIDLCAQDGHKIEIGDLWEGKASVIPAGQVGDLVLTLRHTKKGSADSVLTFVRGDKVIYETTLADFEGPYGWLTSSQDTLHFAVSWKANATVSSTKLFTVEADGSVSEDAPLISKVEHRFESDAHRVCSDPAINLQAIKWIDADHLLLAANSWGSFTCHANFDEGFILEPTKHTIQRVLDGGKLINLPAVCTWNLVPAEILNESAPTSLPQSPLPRPAGSKSPARTPVASP